MAIGEVVGGIYRTWMDWMDISQCLRKRETDGKLQTTFAHSIITKPMDVLCVVAHPDDEILGVGGTLARHAENGDDVHICILSDGVTSRHDERTPQVEEEIEQRKKRAKRACGKLGIDSVSLRSFPDNQFDTVALLEIVKAVEDEIENVNPSLVYTHHYGDLNIDHELTCRAVQTATRPLKESDIERVLAFETLSASEWSLPDSRNSFEPTVFTNISNTLDAKLEALAEYEGELREAPHPRTIETVKQNAKVWGAKSGLEAAEPFELLREVNR
jgi:LmbE family N-acetylglucosaminyl deacetylase